MDSEGFICICVCVHAYINIAMIKKGQEVDGVKETQEEFGTGRGRGRKDGSKEFNSKILKIFNSKINSKYE